MPFKCEGHPVSLWRWPLTCNLEKCYSLRSSFGMYNLERRLRYLHLLTRNCPCNLLPEPTSPKHESRGKLWGHLWRHRWCHHHGIFLYNLRWFFFHIWGQIEAVFNIMKFSKLPPFWARDKLFLPEVIPEVEYTRKIAISISDILSFWSTQLKYWRIYSIFKIWPILWPGDVINGVMSTWNITCTTRHPQQYTCKIVFVWH